MAHGLLNLVAIMDWHSRKVLSWRLSNTMDDAFCVEAFIEAISTSGPRRSLIPIKGRNLPRRWRSVKYEEVYLRTYDSGREARAGIGAYFEHHNSRRRMACAPKCGYYGP